VISALSPVPTELSLPFWSAAKEHRLTVQTCTQCRKLHFPPVPSCTRCTSEALHWQDVSGQGRVITWTVTHQSYHPDLATPYAVVLIELVEEPNLLMYGNYRGALETLAVGTPVRAVYEDRPDDWTLIQWMP